MSKQHGSYPPAGAEAETHGCLRRPPLLKLGPERRPVYDVSMSREGLYTLTLGLALCALFGLILLASFPSGMAALPPGAPPSY